MEESILLHSFNSLIPPSSYVKKIKYFHPTKKYETTTGLIEGINGTEVIIDGNVFELKHFPIISDWFTYTIVKEHEVGKRGKEKEGANFYVSFEKRDCRDPNFLSMLIIFLNAHIRTGKKIVILTEDGKLIITDGGKKGEVIENKDINKKLIEICKKYDILFNACSQDCFVVYSCFDTIKKLEEIYGTKTIFKLLGPRDLFDLVNTYNSRPSRLAFGKLNQYVGRIPPKHETEYLNFKVGEHRKPSLRELSLEEIEKISPTLTIEQKNMIKIYNIIKGKLNSEQSSFVPLQWVYEKSCLQDKEDFLQACKKLVGQKSIVISGQHVTTYLRELEEVVIANVIVSLLSINDLSSFQIFPTNLHTEQAEAIENVCSHAVSMISGGAGTGKSHLTKELCGLFSDVLVTSFQANNIVPYKGIPNVISAVIHQILYWHEISCVDSPYCVPGSGTDKRYVENLNIHYKKCPLEDIRVILIEETSLISQDLLSRFLLIVKRCCKELQKLVFIGDENQLQSISPGNIIKDLTKILKKAGQISVLQENHRVEPKSRKLADYGMKIINEEPISPDNDVFIHLSSNYSESSDIAKQIINHVKKFKLLEKDYIILTVENKVAHDIAYQLKKQQGQTLGHLQISSKKVMSKKNLYKYGIHTNQVMLSELRDYKCDSNNVSFYKSVKDCNVPIPSGHQRQFTMSPLIDNLCEKAKIIPVKHLKNLVDASIVTINSSQGGEFDVVFIVIPEIKFYNTLESFYTAFTRAKKKVILIGPPNTIQSVLKNRCRERTTMLVEKISPMIEPREKQWKKNKKIKKTEENEQEEIIMEDGMPVPNEVLSHIITFTFHDTFEPEMISVATQYRLVSKKWKKVIDTKTLKHLLEIFSKKYGIDKDTPTPKSIIFVTPINHYPLEGILSSAFSKIDNLSLRKKSDFIGIVTFANLVKDEIYTLDHRDPSTKRKRNMRIIIKHRGEAWSKAFLEYKETKGIKMEKSVHLKVKIAEKLTSSRIGVIDFDELRRHIKNS